VHIFFVFYLIVHVLLYLKYTAVDQKFEAFVSHICFARTHLITAFVFSLS
jgi:hypothetical protein